MENRKILTTIQAVLPYVLIILLAVVARLLPHPPNFAPMGALALFSGARFKNKIAWFIPMIAMLISDWFLGWHSTIIYVYASFFITIMIGIGLKKKLNPERLLLASLFSSVLFFLITNFGVWAAAGLYPKTINGLYQSYLMGLPFFRNTILSDFFYSFSFFYGFEYLSSLLRVRVASRV